MRKVASRLKAAAEKVDLLVSSPFVRAQQTADILAEKFKTAQRIEAMELVPHSPPQAFVRWLKAHAREAASVMVVGHEPQMSLFASYILCGSDESVIDLKKAGVILMSTNSVDELGPYSGELKWLIPPKIWAE